MAAARYWAIGGADPQRRAALLDAQALAASMRDWRASDEQLAPVQAEIARLSAEADCDVHSDNALSTQWHLAGGLAGAARVGLSYPAAEAVMRLHGVPAKRRAALFADLQVMELAALQAAAEQRSADAGAGAGH